MSTEQDKNVSERRKKPVSDTLKAELAERLPEEPGFTWPSEDGVITNPKAEKPFDASEEDKVAAGKLTDTLFPEGGRKTWLDEGMLVRADRLKTLRSTIKNIKDDIDQKKRYRAKGATADDSLEKQLKKLGRDLTNAKRERKGLVAVFISEYEKLSARQSEMERALGALDENAPEYRKKLRERFELGNALDEVVSIIGEKPKENTKEERDPDAPAEETPESSPRQEDGTPDEVSVLEARLSELEAEKRKLETVAWSEQDARKRLDGIRDALPGTDIEDLVEKDRKEWEEHREQRIEEGIPEEIERIRENLARAREEAAEAKKNTPVGSVPEQTPKPSAAVSRDSAEVPSSPAVVPENESGPLSGAECAAFASARLRTESFEVSDTVRERFGALGIGEDDLRSVDGFENLSEGRRLFVASMLRQSSVARVESRARERAESGWSLTKGFRLAKARKELAGSALGGGMTEYREDLVRLTEGIVMSGLDLTEKDGRFEIRFLSPADGTDADESLRTKMESLGSETGFDEAAARLSEIPYAWSLDGATKAERADAAAARAAYESARAGMDARLEDDPAGRVLLRVAEHRIGLVRQMRSHPEVDGYLEKLRSGNVFIAAFRTTLAERGGYFVAGAAGRMALAGALGWVAAPVVAAGMGAFTSRKRAKEGLLDRDRRAREGDETAMKGDLSKGFVFASLPEGNRKGLAEKLGLLTDLAEHVLTEDAAKKSKDTAKKPKDPESGLKSLAERISYTRRKLDAGEVNFGKGSDAIRNRIALMESLARAEAVLGVYSGRNAELGRRLDSLLDRHAGKVDLARERHVRSEMLRGAAISGTIAFLGSASARGVSEWFSGGDHEVVETAVPRSGSGSSIAPAAVPESVPLSPAAPAAVARSVFEETANRGDGVTHLARRAFSEYAEGKPELADLGPEQKVYIEHYLQKHVAHSGTLHPGDTVGFSRDLMDEAIGKARMLDESQILNLHRYSERVAEFRTGTPSAEPFTDASVGRVSSSDAVAETLRSSGAETVSEPPVYGFRPVDMNEPLPWDADVREWVPGYDEGRVLYPTLDHAPESVIRSMAKNESVVEFLSEDTRRLIPFQKTMAALSTDLFPSTTGGVDKGVFLEVGARRATDVFDGCFRAVDDPSRAAEFGMNPEEAERLGKFLLAAHDRYGIAPKSDGSEHFREYMERVSAAMIGKLDDPGSLRDMRVDDRRLRAFARMISSER